MEVVELGVCEARYWPADPNRVALVLPGAHYLPAYPLLWFCRETALAQKWSVLEVWDELEDHKDPDDWVRERLEAGLQRSGGGLICLIAKSISTRAFALPAAADLPWIGLTPLLGEPAIAEAVSAHSARMLLIGGTADRTWQEGAVGSADVLEIAGADHALQIDGDPLASVNALRLVVERVGAFLAALERTTRPSAA